MPWNSKDAALKKDACLCLFAQQSKPYIRVGSLYEHTKILHNTRYAASWSLLF